MFLDAEAVQVVLEYRNPRARSHLSRTGRDGRNVHDREAKVDILAATQIGVMISARVDPMAAAKLAETIATDFKTW